MEAIMNLDQNVISLQPAKFHAISTLLPRWPPYWHPPLILRCDFLRPYCSRKACAIYSTSLLVINKTKPRGQSGGSSVWMVRPYNMQEELGWFYSHQKGIIWSMSFICSFKRPIMKQNMKPYFRAWSELSHSEQIQSSSKETQSWWSAKWMELVKLRKNGWRGTWVKLGNVLKASQRPSFNSY